VRQFVPSTDANASAGAFKIHENLSGRFLCHDLSAGGPKNVLDGLEYLSAGLSLSTELDFSCHVCGRNRLIPSCQGFILIRLFKHEIKKCSGEQELAVLLSGNEDVIVFQ
jgi:hypothetical protein